MMLEQALPKAKSFGQEKSAWRAATFEPRNHSVVISKTPRDISRLHRIRNFYKNRQAALKTIVMIRDPRDVLSSKHPKTGTHRYFQETDRWMRQHADVMRYLHDPQVLVLRYEELVSDPNSVQARIDAFTGEQSERCFSDATANVPSDFDTHPLNGVRPVDCHGIGRWAKREHRHRMEEILRDIPQLPQILIDLGYETDTSWLDRIWPNKAPALQPAHATIDYAAA